MENRLNHKTENIDIYLRSISGSLSEKTEIASFIESARHEGAHFLEIGSGGDPVAQMVHLLPESDQTIELDVIDIDRSILDSLLLRHPELIEDAKQKGIDITLKTMDATDMHEYESGTMNAINASSIVHELFSYAGGFEGVKKFITEINRLLTPEGILFYRDPELNQPLEYSVAHLIHPNLKALCFYYLANAVNTKPSDRQEPACRSGLSDLYNLDTVRIAYSDKASGEQKVISIDEISMMHLTDVDFDTDVRLFAEYGVIKEVMRHFLTFHQSSPFGTVYFTQEEDGLAKVHYASSNTEKRWLTFAGEKGVHMNDGQLLEIEDYERAAEAMNDEFKFLQSSTALTLNSLKSASLEQYFSARHIPFIPIEQSANTFEIDSLQLSLQYEQLMQDGLLAEEDFVSPTAYQFFQYIKQEARETYFYFTPDELIAFVAYTSYAYDGKYILVPRIDNTVTNRSASRPMYDEFLQRSLRVEALANPQVNDELLPREVKRLIQFIKLPTNEALQALEKITLDNTDKYNLTRQVYEELLNSYSDTIK